MHLCGLIGWTIVWELRVPRARGLTRCHKGSVPGYNHRPDRKVAKAAAVPRTIKINPKRASNPAVEPPDARSPVNQHQ